MKKIKLINAKSIYFNGKGNSIQILDFFQVSDVIQYLLNTKNKINYILDLDFLTKKNKKGQEVNEKEYDVFDILQFYSAARKRKDVNVTINIENKDLNLESILDVVNQEYIDKMKKAKTDFLIPVSFNAILFGQNLKYLDFYEAIEILDNEYHKDHFYFKDAQIYALTNNQEFQKTQKCTSTDLIHLLIMSGANSIAISKGIIENETIEFKTKDKLLEHYLNFNPKTQNKEELFNRFK